MGEFRYLLDSHNLAAGADDVSAATEQTDFSEDNLTRFPVARPWRSATGDTDVDIIVSLHGTRLVNFAAVLNTNLTSPLGTVTLFSGTSDTGPWTHRADFHINPWIGRAYWTFLGTPPISSQYWRFNMAQTGHPDDYLQAGYLLLGQTLALPWEPNRPYIVSRLISQRSNSTEQQSPIIGATLSERSLVTVTFEGMSANNLLVTEHFLAECNLRRNAVAFFPDGADLRDDTELFFGRLQTPQIVQHEQGGTKTIADLQFLTDPYGIEA